MIRFAGKVPYLPSDIALATDVNDCRGKACEVATGNRGIPIRSDQDNSCVARRELDHRPAVGSDYGVHRVCCQLVGGLDARCAASECARRKIFWRQRESLQLSAGCDAGYFSLWSWSFLTVLGTLMDAADVVTLAGRACSFLGLSRTEKQITIGCRIKITKTHLEMCKFFLVYIHYGRTSTSICQSPIQDGNLHLLNLHQVNSSA